MRCLVTGGAGFIGSHIVELLLEDPGNEVVVVDNLMTGSRDNVSGGCTFIQADICSRSALREAMKDVDVVFHNAAFVSIRGSFAGLHNELYTNCLGTLAVFEEAARARVRKVIFASSMAVYGEALLVTVAEESPTLPLSPYGLSKLRGEMVLRTLAGRCGFEHVILRYFNTYGTRQTPSDYVGVMTTFIRRALLGEPITVYGDGRQTRDFVHVRDVAQANLLAMKSGVTGTFNIGSGHELSINQLADMVLEMVGGAKFYEPAPPGEILCIRADIRRARDVLGYNPRGDIRVVLGELVDWWEQKLRAEGHGDRLRKPRRHVA
ncbi:MAG TPA: NAD-dependent epimerase/dehydratase family protein [Planctomycetota bacterium]|nr:NAD-dependent epimerase/dehydratase family protein [Planctomycetota bacterium]